MRKARFGDPVSRWLALSSAAMLAVGAIGGGGGNIARAANGTWTDGSGDSFWANPLNWSDGVVPGVADGTTTNADTAIFNANVPNAVVIVDANRNIKNITFDTAAGAYTIGIQGSGSTLLLLTAGGTTQIASTFAGTGITETINAPLVLEPAGTTGTAASYTVANNASDPTDLLVFAGNISGGSNTTTTSGSSLTLSGTNTGNNLISGNISDGSLAGGLALSKSGTGTWTLSGTNSYSGMTVVSGGVLNLNGATSGSASLNVVGGVVNVNGSFIGSAGISPNSTVSSTSGAVSRLSVNAGGVFNAGTSRSLIVAAASTSRGMIVINGGSLTAANLEEATGGSNAAGATYLSGAGASFTSTSVANNNSFSLGMASAGFGYFDMAGGTGTASQMDVGGASGGNGLLEISTGTFTASLNGGTKAHLVMDHSNVANQAAVVNLSGTGTLDVSAVGPSGGRFSLGDGVANGQFAMINLSGTAVLNAAGTSMALNRLGALTTITNTAAQTAVLNLNGGRFTVNAITVEPASDSNGQFALSLVNFNGGALQASASTTTFLPALINGTAYNPASGVYVYGGGATVDTNGFNVTVAAPLLAVAGQGVTSIPVSSGGSGYIAPPIIEVSGGSGVGATAVANMVDDGTGNGTYKIGSITITSAGSGYAAGDTLTVSMVGNTSLYATQASLGTPVLGTDVSTGGFTKNGAGTLTLSGASTYTGPTVINAGTFKAAIATTAGVSGALGVNSAVTLANVAGATLDITGYNTQIGSLTGGGTAGGNITLGAATLTVGADNTSPAAYAGSISGTGGALTKIGTGTLTLSGANTYTGASTVTGGTLVLNGSGAGQVNINGGTNTTVTVTNATAFSGQIGFLSPAVTPRLNLHIDGAGFNSTITINAGLYNSSSVVGTIDVDNDGSGNTGNVIFLNGDLAFGNTTLNVTGAHGYGLTLGGISNQAGGLGGTITFNPTTAPLSIGTLTSTHSSGTDTFALGGTNAGNSITGTISNGTGTDLVAVTKSNTGTWVLSGNSTYTGATTVSGGVLRVDGTLADTPTTVATGATLAGKGTIGNANSDLVTISGFIAPGSTSTTANFTTGAQQWNAGGTYTWKLNTANAGATQAVTNTNGIGTTDTGGAGTDWDMLTMTALTLPSSGTFTIAVTPLSGTGSSPFSAGGTYRWTIADVTTGGGNYASLLANLKLDTSAFTAANPSVSSGAFSLSMVPDGGSNNGDDLVINYAPAPEPTSLALAGLAAGGLIVRRRRR